MRRRGVEILNQITCEPLAFVSGVGTGGTLMGIGKRLKEKFRKMQIVAIEPDKMPIISKGEIISQHKIEGIGDDFLPDLVNKAEIDDVILIDDDDAINMSKKLARDLGVGVGISSGANFIGAVLATEKFEKKNKDFDESKNGVVTVFADDNKKYISTDLFKVENSKKNYISENIKLLYYESV